MSKASLSPELFDALGLNTWRLSPDFDQAFGVGEQKNLVPQAHNEQTEALNLYDGGDEGNTLAMNAVDSSDGEGPGEALSLIKLIFIGQGLEQIWQDESRQEWLLMSNILQALDVLEDSVLYFDSSLLHTEDAIEMTIEEIIETGVDQVFSFDENGVLNEVLAEGLQVEVLPDLAAMLSQPHAKKHSYYCLASYVG